MMPIRLMIALLFSMLLFSCTSTKPITEVPVKTETIITERLVPVVVHDDSVLVKALFECDSNNRVLMLQFDEHKTKNVVTANTFKNGIFTYKATAIHDTVYIPVMDTLIVKDVPIVVTKEVQGKPPLWQIILMCLGVGLIIIVIINLFKMIKT